MLLRRAGRVSAALLGQAFQAPGSFRVQVQASRPTDRTVWLRGGRPLCVDAALAHLGTRPQARDPHPILNSSSGFVTTQRGHLDRVNATAASPPRSARTLVGVERRHISRGPSVGSVLFTHHWGVSCCSVRPTQTRASSTAAAAKKSEERATDGDKGDEQNVKEASAAEKAPMEPQPEAGKPNKTQQLKKVFKEYGAVGVSFHIGISLMSLGMFYLLLSSGIDMTALLCRLGFSEAVVQSKMAAGTSTFVLAYAVHKLFAPVRISITLVSVPLIVRYLRKTGLFKPPTPAP